MDKATIQQKIGRGQPGILAINRLLLLPPLPRTNNVVRRTDSKQPRAGAGGRRQYSTAIQVPPLPSSSSDTLTLLCWGLKKLKINSIFFFLLGLAMSGLQGRNAKAKVQQQKQKLTCDISARHAGGEGADGAPSPPRDGDTTGGGGGGVVFPCNYIVVLRNGCICA